MDRRAPRGRRRARHTATAVAVLLAIGGTALIVAAITAQQPTPPRTPPAAGEVPTPTPRADSSASTSPRTAPANGPRAVEYSPPVQLHIPTLGVNSPLVTVGLDADGVMETPEPVTRAGWFRPSPPPGVPGATVISGHLTWDQQPMVFFRLGQLRPHDRVQVTRKDGIVTVFEVTRIGSFAKNEFPTKAVYSQPKRSELRLITCGGDFDEADSRYTDNVIVWAEIIDIQHRSD